MTLTPRVCVIACLLCAAACAQSDRHLGDLAPSDRRDAAPETEIEGGVGFDGAVSSPTPDGASHGDNDAGIEDAGSWWDSFEDPRDPNACADAGPGTAPRWGSTWNEAGSCWNPAVLAACYVPDPEGCGDLVTQARGPDGRCWKFATTCIPPGFEHFDSDERPDCRNAAAPHCAR